MVFWLKIVLIGGSILAAAGLKYAFPQIKPDYKDRKARDAEAEQLGA